MQRVLIVEDDQALARGLVDNLRYEGLEVSHVASGEEGLERLRQKATDLLLLDLMLPGISGFDLLRELRKGPGGPRIVVVSARDAEADVVRALDLGAHDYVRKPFGLTELLARVRAQLRQTDASQGAPEEETRIGDARVSLRRFRLWKGDQEWLLSHLEVELLRFFLKRPDQPLSRSEILNRVWGEDAYPSERTVDNFVLRLRKKLEDDPRRPRHLKTVHGYGYRFDPGDGQQTEDV